MIDIKNVSKWYGSFQVLTDCTTSIQKGEVVSIIGPSGTGKSTLSKVLAGHPDYAVQSGEAFVDGSSYGDERRMPLRPPVAVLAGPVPLAWAALLQEIDYNLVRRSCYCRRFKWRSCPCMYDFV